MIPKIKIKKQKNQSKFKVGNKIIITKDISDCIKKGMIGIIRHINPNNFNGIDFGKTFDGHNLNGHIATSTGWYVDCNKNAIELYKEPQKNKVIFAQPKTILFYNGKKYLSTCKDETFDKEKGLAMCLLKAKGISYQELKKLLNNSEDKTKVKNTINLLKEEREILQRAFYDGYRYIVRDECDYIHIYYDRPTKFLNCWMGSLYHFYIKRTLFPFIKWADEEPCEIEKLLEEN